MSFFEDLGKTVNYAVGETASRTKELAGVVKLNTSICARQHEIDKTYAAIGRALFEREAADPESPVAALCAKVQANLEAIASMKQQIVDLKAEASEERKARSETIFGNKDAEDVVEEVVEEAAEEAEEVAEDVAEAAEEAAETVADAVETVEEAAEKAAE